MDSKGKMYVAPRNVKSTMRTSSAGFVPARFSDLNTALSRSHSVDERSTTL